MSKKRTEIWAALIVLAIGVILVAIVGLWVSMRDVMPNAAPSILLFNGRGTSPNDVAALDRILTDGRFSYSTASSQQLDDLNESELAAYRLLIVPGGNFEEIGNGLDASTTARLRSAIGGGLNYLASVPVRSSRDTLLTTASISRRVCGSRSTPPKTEGYERPPWPSPRPEGRRSITTGRTGLSSQAGVTSSPSTRRNACRGRRHLRRWIGDSHRDSSRGTGELAPRHDRSRRRPAPARPTQ